MRLWSLHPRYLDSKGLVALWREALLAKAVLEGKTVGYHNHPQLVRFRASENPVDSINKYLEYVYKESVKRGYNFSQEKFACSAHSYEFTVTDKQIAYELKHLLNKLETRNNSEFLLLSSQKHVEPHPIFTIVNGEIEEWEKVYKLKNLP